MDDILDALYCCDIRFTPNQRLAKQSASALDDILREEKKVQAELTPEHWALVETYRDRVEDYQALYAQAQFERGFLIGAKIISAILLREQAPPEQQ